MEISYRFGFDAAHHFPEYPAGHAYHGMHGHSFRAEVAVVGSPDPATGFIVDLGELECACLDVRRELDHKVLNEIAGLEMPSLENLSLWIWARLRPRFAGLARVSLHRDSCGQSCTYTGPEGDLP